MMPPPQNPNDGLQANNYTEGMAVNNLFDFSSGVCVLPIAEDPPESEGELATWSPVVVLRLHAPYRMRKTTYAADKSNTPPVMPSPQKDSGKLIFMGGQMNVTNRMNASNCMWDWTSICDFTYIENCVSRTQDGFVLGAAPWIYESSALEAMIVPPANPTIGAISEAGIEARIGYTQGQMVNFANPLSYTYNIPSFLPGQFFSDQMVDGVVPT